MTELDAINRMLSWIGEIPVTTISSVDVSSRAQSVLAQYSKRIQSRGLTSNKRFEVTYTADGSGFIDVGSALRADPSDRSVNYVQRGVKLYDVENSTDVFPVGKEVSLDVVDYLAWDALPPVTQEYIVAKATPEFIMIEIGDRDLYASASDQARAAEIEFLRYELKVSDANMLQDEHTVAGAGLRHWNP